jgi:hypothetical protein
MATFKAIRPDPGPDEDYPCEPGQYVIPFGSGEAQRHMEIAYSVNPDLRVQLKATFDGRVLLDDLCDIKPPGSGETLDHWRFGVIILVKTLVVSQVSALSRQFDGVYNRTASRDVESRLRDDIFAEVKTLLEQGDG